MNTLILSRLNISNLPKTNLHSSKPKQVSQFLYKTPLFPKIRLNNPSLCTQNISWQDSFKQTSAIDSIDSIEPPETPILHYESDPNILDLNTNSSPKPFSFQNPIFNFKSPMWILGPLVLVTTGILPTLYLPLSSVFLGPNIAGLFSLIGLDCIFNMGAMIFLLMAHSCAPKSQTPIDQISQQIAPNYRACNFGASLIGFILPFILLFLSHKPSFSLLHPQINLISFLVLVGPYLLLLSVQMLTEMLTWHWRSPVWLITPVVYEGYRVLQLMRGINLGLEIGGPVWMVQVLRGLVTFWILVLGIQLMRVSWYVGSTCQINKEEFE